ncbi:MAG: S8 family peptidase [Gammaproteobacteria bacterium]|nr:S8 family peptidase [Gammaproteobacteria bacterium]
MWSSVRTLLVLSVAWTVVSGAADVNAQENAALGVLKVTSKAREVLVMPLETPAEGATAIIGGMPVDVGTEGDFVVYRVRHGGRTHTAYHPPSRPRRWLAFDPGQGRFDEVASSVRVRMTSDEELAALIERMGASGGKAYPALGWALIRFPPTVNPADAVQRLASDPSVESAELLFRDDIQLPMRVPPPDPAADRNYPENAKEALAPDLLAILGDIAIEADKLNIQGSVLNWGAIKSEATRLEFAISNQPDPDGPALWIAEGDVPEIDARSGLTFGIDVLLSRFDPGQDYYLFMQVDEIASEHPRRTRNRDYKGFSLDATGAVVVRCTQPDFSQGIPGASDPLVDMQWHLTNTGQTAFANTPGTPGEDLDMSAALAAGQTGRGVQIAVVDTGLEICHPDLAANVEPGASHNFNAAHWLGALAGDPFFHSTVGDHGTSVAGVAAAVADNGLGGRGVAGAARVRGYNYLEAFDWVGARPDSLGGSSSNPNSTDVDIFNMSFGGLGSERNADPDSDIALYQNGVTNLRDGLGAIYVKSAGNGFGSCRSIPRSVNGLIGCSSTNGDTSNNLPYLIVVGAFGATGVKASYSGSGANLWVSAPAGEFGRDHPAVITTDQMGHNRGYDTLFPRGLSLDETVNTDGNYISSFNGTSAAAPNTAGAIALLLAAHPGLTWRDVKHILARTARQIDPDRPEVRYRLGGAAYLLQEPWEDEDPAERARNWYRFGATPYTLQLPWITNAAGYHYHNWYGFGAVSVDDALEYAASHTPDSLGEFTESPPFESATAADIPDFDSGGLTRTLVVTGLSTDANIEAVTLEIDVTHPFTNDLGIHLISPSGTESVLNPVFNDVLAGNADLDWHLLSNAFYGESPNGEWTLKIVDAAPEDAGTLNAWRLRFALGAHPD